jgi:hypothetical protein
MCFFGFFGISVPLHRRRRENNSIKKKSQMFSSFEAKFFFSLLEKKLQSVTDGCLPSTYQLLLPPLLLLLLLDDGNDHSFNQFVLGWSHILSFHFHYFFKLFFSSFWWKCYAWNYLHTSSLGVVVM